MLELICPDCRAEIPEDDFNIAKDIAYCRSCSTMFEFSALTKRAELEQVDLEEMPKHLKVVPHYQGEILEYKKVPAEVLFLIFFDLFWTGIVSAAIFLPEEGEGPPILFLIPFVLVSIGIFFGILFMLFGKQTFSVGDHETVIRHGLAGIARKKSFLNDDVKSIIIQKGTFSVNDVVQDEICVNLHSGGTVKFGATIEEYCQKYVASWLQSKLER